MATPAYTTDAEVRTNLGNANLSVGEVPAANVTQAITKAEAIIRTKLPHDLVDDIDALATTPPIVKSMAQDLASYFVMRGIYRDNAPELSAWVDTYKRIDNEDPDAPGILQLIRNQEVSIDEIEDQVQMLSSTNGYIPTFANDDPRKWGIDQDRLDDIADERED